MNDHLTVGEWFYREIDEFENAPADCRQTADGCALDAYLCPSNQWTIGDGCCFWEDGRPVQQGDTLPDDEHLPERRRKLLGFNAKYCEEYVRRYVTVPLTQNQFDVLCGFRFNTRETTLSGSSRLLPAINAQKWQDAAVAMTEFVYGSGSKRGPVKLPPKGWDVEKSGGQWWAIPPDHLFGAERIALGAEEKWYPYQDAHRGLLRRRLWGGLVFLDYDPRDVTKDNDVALPTKAKLLSTGVWRDSISAEGLTTLAHVRMRAKPLPTDLVLTIPASPPQAAEVAQRQPDPARSPAAGATIAPIEKPPLRGPTVAPAGEGVKSLPPTTSAPAAKPASVPAVIPAPVGTKPPSPNTKMPEHVPYRIDPQAGLKPMEETERFVGAALMLFGTFARVIMANGTALTGVGGVVVVAILDMMKSPTNLAILVTVITMGITAVLWVIAFIIDKLGLKIKKRGEATSTQAMY